MTRADTIHSHFIASTCGTSALTNQADAPIRAALNRISNMQEEEALEALGEDRDVVLAHLDARHEQLLDADHDEARRLCAELNGLLTLLFDDASPDVRHHSHTLIATDTYLGRRTAEMVRGWLELNRSKDTVDVFVAQGLQARDAERFKGAVSELAKWSGEALAGRAKGGYHVTMNLTGGFKSANGVIQSLGALFADEIVYLFEGAQRGHNELIRIPRLPVKLDHEATFEANLAACRLMVECDHPLPRDRVDAIPEALLMEVDTDLFQLSLWGEALWSEFADARYREGLLPSPLPERLAFGPKLAKSVANQPGDRLRTINKTIDQNARHILTHGAYNKAKSFDYKKLRGKPYNGESTHECDLWASKGGYRLFMHEEARGGAPTRVIDLMHTGLH